MKILVLGGTVFLGRHFVEAALAEGHDLTLFHRGQHGAEMFPQVRHVFGDRDGGLDALPDEHWDAVVDCCGYFPRVVRSSSEYLAERVGRYLFVSTISVYANGEVLGLNENAAVGTIDDPTFEQITGESYGPLKALCEDAVREVYGDRALIIRPGLIAGPWDTSNRFTYWADRAARGGPFLVPDRSSQPFQIIDVRDLAEFMLHCLVTERAGNYNATGPSRTFGDFLDVLRRIWPTSTPIAKPIAFMQEHQIEFWKDWPLTLSAEDKSDGFLRVDVTKAMEAGLTCRPWEETATDTHKWSASQPADRPKPFGMSEEREAELL